MANDRTLTLTYDEDACQVVLEGLFPCGPAGEASLDLAEGIELSFDRADGRLRRIVVEASEPGNPLAIGEPALAAVASLLGSRTRAAIEQAPSRDGDPVTITAEAETMTALSRLARLDAARLTSPVADSPLWAVEAARLALRAGLDTRVRAEARRAANALDGADGASPVMLAAAADGIADLVEAVEPELATRLRKHAAPPRPAAAHRLRRPSPDAAAGRGGESGGPPGWLDPHLIPAGIFRHAMSPDAELAIREDKNGIVVEATIIPGADRRVLARCRARLVDPASRSVIAAAPFRSLGNLRVRAEIRAGVPLDSAWVEIADDETRPVSSSKLHHIRRAMRWAETALGAGRQVCGLADAVWVGLAARSWERCAEDWSAADDPDRAYLAAVRRAAICPGVVVPEEPSAWAKELAGRQLLAEEPFLAERAGC